MNVRDAVDADATAVAAIFDHYVRDTVATFETEPRTATQWLTKWAALRAAGWPCLVAEDDGAVIGFAHAGPWRSQPAYRHTVETTVYLAAEHVGAGHGRTLLEALLQRAAAAGAREAIAVIATEADGAGDASIRMHRRLGFEAAGTLHRVGEKFGRHLDTVLMQRTLP
jgi:phosphinothricin acetyltransferase